MSECVRYQGKLWEKVPENWCGSVKGEIKDLDKLEAENEELRQALSGRTVSCEACNGMAKERDDLKRRVEGHLAEIVMKCQEKEELQRRVAELEENVKDWETWASMTGKEFKNYNDLRKENEELKRRVEESERGEVLKQYQIWHSDNVRKIIDLETEKREISTLCKSLAGVLGQLSDEIDAGPKHTGMTLVFLDKAKSALEQYRKVFP